MILPAPFILETIVWVFATTIIAIWVTRVYINTIIALGFGKVKNKFSISEIKNYKKGRAPFITVFLAVYNEPHVIDRLLNAATNFDYPKYEIVVADDSNDESTLSRLRKWEKKGLIKLIHRDNRSGFKAGALNNALKYIDKRSRYFTFFDADYVPPKDILWRLSAHFSSKKIGAVQGYTKHTLNASQNAFTKSVSVIFASYCMVDVPVRRKFKGFIPLAGSVFMVSRESLADVGGFNESSITEDYELSSKLVTKGYEIAYDESISAEAECPSTYRALIRQQMRWAEGMVRDTKNNLFVMLKNPSVNFMKKFDFAFYGFGSLNGIWGCIAYVLSVFIFLVNARIFVTLGVDTNLILSLGTFGKFLVFVAPVYIPSAAFFSSVVALHRENRMYNLKWFAYLFLISFTVAPFIALGGIKGLVTKKGSWARTPKTGRVISLAKV